MYVMACLALAHKLSKAYSQPCNECVDHSMSVSLGKESIITEPKLENGIGMPKIVAKVGTKST